MLNLCEYNVCCFQVILVSDTIHKDWNLDGVMHLKLFYVSQLSYYILINMFDV